MSLLHTSHTVQLERAVDYCFRLIGEAGYTAKRAIAFASEYYHVSVDELSIAYDEAIARASESD